MDNPLIEGDESLNINEERIISLTKVVYFIR